MREAKIEREDGGVDAYRCDNCEYVWKFCELEDLHGYFERVEAGGVMPAGDCPDKDCGAFCYPVGNEPLDLGTPAHIVTTTLWLVIQEGGSSSEHYPSLYTQEQDAIEAAEGHREASYRSTQPIPVPAEVRDGAAFVGELDLIHLIEQVRHAEYV